MKKQKRESEKPPKTVQTRKLGGLFIVCEKEDGSREVTFDSELSQIFARLSNGLNWGDGRALAFITTMKIGRSLLAGLSPESRFPNPDNPPSLKELMAWYVQAGEIRAETAFLMRLLNNLLTELEGIFLPVDSPSLLLKKQSKKRLDYLLDAWYQYRRELHHAKTAGAYKGQQLPAELVMIYLARDYVAETGELPTKQHLKRLGVRCGIRITSPKWAEVLKAAGLSGLPQAKSPKRAPRLI